MLQHNYEKNIFTSIKNFNCCNYSNCLHVFIQQHHLHHCLWQKRKYFSVKKKIFSLIKHNLISNNKFHGNKHFLHIDVEKIFFFTIIIIIFFPFIYSTSGWSLAKINKRRIWKIMCNVECTKGKKNKNI